MKELTCISYGSISFFTVILHNVFLIYHVDVFVNVYKIDKLSFWLGEIIFLVWNSCNDPLFGWISDKHYLMSHGRVRQNKIVDDRLRALIWNGPLLAFSFLLFWFSWSFPSIQFVVCLCAYDGFLTMIDLHHSALLADLSISFDVRTRMNMYCSFFSALGSLFVFLSYIFWDKHNLFPFQKFCIVTSLIAIAGFIATVRFLKHAVQNYNNSQDFSEFHKNEEESHMDSKAAFKKFVFQLSGHKNLVLFTAMNLVQVFHCHFNSNFFPLFLGILLGENASPVVCSVLLGLSFVAPHINNIYFLVLSRKYGAYNVIKFLFIFKLILSIFMFSCGKENIWLLGAFIASNRVFTEGTCKLLNLVITDLVDEDVVLHNRKQAVSALMFGTIAFFSKPGQTFAPIIGTLLLSHFTNKDVFEARSNTNPSEDIDSMMMTDGTNLSPFSPYQSGVFNMLIVVPVFCSVLQLAAWNFFNLHGKRLQLIKSLRSNLKFSAAV